MHAKWNLTFTVFEFYRGNQTLYFLMQDFYSNLLSFWLLGRRVFLEKWFSRWGKNYFVGKKNIFFFIRKTNFSKWSHICVIYLEARGHFLSLRIFFIFFFEIEDILYSLMVFFCLRTLKKISHRMVVIILYWTLFFKLTIPIELIISGLLEKCHDSAEKCYDSSWDQAFVLIR